MTDGTLYSLVQTFRLGTWHVVSRWAADDGQPRTVCGRIFTREQLTKNGRRLYGRELGAVDLCGSCNRLKDRDEGPCKRTKT